jgi:hypothetical protein
MRGICREVLTVQPCTMQVTVSERTFGLKVRVKVGGDEPSAWRSATKFTDTLSTDDEDSDAMGWALHNAGRAFIWLKSWPESRRQRNNKTLVHECVHVAMSFLRDHIREDIRKAEETCCYLVQHLVDEIEHKLKKRRNSR